MVQELAEVATLVTARVYQLSPGLSLGALARFMPSILKAALCRTRIQARFTAALEGKAAATTHNQVAFQVWARLSSGGAPPAAAVVPQSPLQRGPSPASATPAPSPQAGVRETLAAQFRNFRRSVGAITMAWFTSGLFLAMRWWVSAIPMLAISVTFFVEMLLEQAPGRGD